MTRRVALFGGTFDPPHIGHVSAAKTALDALAPDRLYWMPARGAPHKTHPAAAAPEQRLDMCRLAARETGARVTVSGYEMTPGVSAYTADTMSWLRETEPDAELWLVIGQDMLVTLEQWYQADRLLRLCRIAALCRANGQDASIIAAAEALRRNFQAVVQPLPHQPVEISSTRLREELKHGQGRNWLPPPVWEYIRERGLYREMNDCSTKEE